MSTQEPTFEFGLSLEVAHHLNIALGGGGCFHTVSLESETVQGIANDEEAQEIAARVHELATQEPPVVEIDEKYQRTDGRRGEDGEWDVFQYVQPTFITGPYDTPDLVGVPLDSEYLYPNNRIDVVSRE